MNTHKQLFSDIYEWAGSTRNVNTETVFDNKIPLIFAKVNFIDQELNTVFNQIKSFKAENKSTEDKINFVAKVFGDLIAIHPFRDGNGRTTRLFVNKMLKQYGLKEVDFGKVEKNRYLYAGALCVVRADYSEISKIFNEAQ